MLKKEYTNGDITVVWEPGLCIHSGVCFRSLPKVFRPRERPWIQMENADTPTIEDTVNACPSGALSIKSKIPQPDAELISSLQGFNVQIMPNGPVRFKGPCKVTLQDLVMVDPVRGAAFEELNHFFNRVTRWQVNQCVSVIGIEVIDLHVDSFLD